MISEYKDEIVENNCTDSIMIKLVNEKNSKNSKLNSHLERLKSTIRSSNKELPQGIEEEIIIDFLIEYFKQSKKRTFFAQKIFEKTFY